ncbi:MAG TPA: AMP-binding protein, partial [Acidimicrobiales bacterium]
MTVGVGGSVARLVLDTAERRPGAAFGTVEEPVPLAAAVARGAGFARRLAAEHGLRPGDRVALVGTTSTSYLTAWLGLQLAGVEAALVNPTYTDDMLRTLLAGLDPAALVVSGRSLSLSSSPSSPSSPLSSPLSSPSEASGRLSRIPVIDATDLSTAGDDGDPAGLPGLDRDDLDVAGYMHTSGTTGLPKFCAQSHAYFRRLGAAISGALGLRPDDVVFAPLPMYHVNPLGYGVLGALTAGAGVLGARRFSASEFWDQVVAHDVSALVLHAPPVEILKRSTTPAPEHRVRAMFFGDAEFLRRFGIDRAVTAYGSTEAGGVTHLHVWTAAEAAAVDEATEGPISRYGGEARADVDWRVDDDGAIRVRAVEPGALFSGYLVDGVVTPAVDEDGWFDTGDIGAVDPRTGGLRFVERRAESVRVKGEYVPIPLVESALAGLRGVDDLAVWKRPGPLGDGDDEVVLFTAPA